MSRPCRLVLRLGSIVFWDRRVLRWSVVALSFCLTVGCSRLLPGRRRAATVAPGSTSPAGAPAVQFLGTVHVIGNGSRFVLVQAAAPAMVAGLVDGQALVCRAAGNVTATLRVSRERRPPFVVADVVTGTPHLGDDVFTEPAVDHPTPAPTLSPSAPTLLPASTPEFRASPGLPASQ